MDNSNSLKLVDPVRFPLTTQPELSEDQQGLLDAINLDDIHEGIENGEGLNEFCMLKLKELEAKHQLRRERAIANGWVPKGESALVDGAKPVFPNAEYQGDPQWRLTTEESARVAKSHREMMG